MPRYVPEPVPSFSEDTRAKQELRRYLIQELDRISEAVNQKVDRAYGGIFQTTALVVISPLTSAPVLFDPFDVVTPERPDGVLGLPAAGSIAVLSGGAYMMAFSTSVVNILPNAEYGFLLAKNGVSTGLGGEINPSNQTTNVLLGVNILVNAQKGDIFTMLINSASNDDASITGAEFSMSRVSEEQ